MPFLLAERARKACSLDARSKGQLWPLLNEMRKEVKGRRSTASVEPTPLPVL